MIVLNDKRLRRSKCRVEVDVMRPSAIVAFLQGPVVGIAALFGLCSVTAAADSAHVQSIGVTQAVAPAAPSSDAGVASAPFTVLKTSISPIQPPGARIQLPSSTVSQPSTAGAVVPGQSSASAGRPLLDGVEFLTPAQQRSYQRAASAFSLFCHDWERMLHEREVNNLDHLSWRREGGLETATYTGYGRVEGCECKASKEGLPIGKIRYRERNYLIAGQTIDQARRTTPKLTHEINDLEIFSWDKGKWFY
jgi:hypothetical protein